MRTKQKALMVNRRADRAIDKLLLEHLSGAPLPASVSTRTSEGRGHEPANPRGEVLEELGRLVEALEFRGVQALEERWITERGVEAVEAVEAVEVGPWPPSIDLTLLKLLARALAAEDELEQLHAVAARSRTAGRAEIAHLVVEALADRSPRERLAAVAASEIGELRRCETCKGRTAHAPAGPWRCLMCSTEVA